jgi:hypothetical protein
MVFYTTVAGVVFSKIFSSRAVGCCPEREPQGCSPPGGSRRLELPPVPPPASCCLALACAFVHRALVLGEELAYLRADRRGHQALPRIGKIMRTLVLVFTATDLLLDNEGHTGDTSGQSSSSSPGCGTARASTRAASASICEPLRSTLMLTERSTNMPICLPCSSVARIAAPT